MSRHFPIGPGAGGEPVRDVQRRLASAGFAAVGAHPGVYCPVTEAAVRSFQTARGLRESGTCDEQTWLALVEAGWRLGDRLLMLTAPQLRGDDVAQLQSALSHLGFDCGRPDGIFGPATMHALADFQKNGGLSVDGICGPRTGRMLELLSRQSGSGPGVASLRENELMLAGRGSLPSLRIVVGQFGGLSSITRAVARSLRQGGASVMSTDEYEAPAQASAANRFGADAYIGFEAIVGSDSTVSYFAVPTFESVGGRSLADRVVRTLAPTLEGSVSLQGMRLPVLRETRMPAVLCSLGPVRHVVDATDAIAAAIHDAVAEWGSSPLTVPSA